MLIPLISRVRRAWAATIIALCPLAPQAQELTATDTAHSFFSSDKASSDRFGNETGSLDGRNRASEFLSVAQAFRPSLLSDGDTYTIEWLIAPDYYLYKRQFKLLSTPSQQGEVAQELSGLARYSRGLQKFDGYFGQVEVYYHGATITLDKKQLAEQGSPQRLELIYQGCAEAGLCYPEQRYRFELD